MLSALWRNCALVFITGQWLDDKAAGASPGAILAILVDLIHMQINSG
jgi:hypothetical protein